MLLFLRRRPRVKIFFFPGFFSFLPRIGIRRSRIRANAYVLCSVGPSTPRLTAADIISAQNPRQVNPNRRWSMEDVGTDSDNGYQYAQRRTHLRPFIIRLAPPPIRRFRLRFTVLRRRRLRKRALVASMQGVSTIV